MKGTTKYALPQWEKQDQIRMDDFNDAFGKIETALSGHDDSLDGKASTAAVTAVQQEVAAAREANCLVKLAGPLVTTAANAAMEFDLSQVDMTKVAALFFTFCAGASNGSMTLSVNGTSLGTMCNNSWSTSAGILWIVPYVDGLAFYANLIRGTNSSGGQGATTTVQWAAINSITFSGSSDAGATATLFAVKK